METPSPGIYPDVAPDEYHAWDAISNSGLTAFIRSPAHYVAKRESEKEPTKALHLGRAIHAAVLEPERFEEVYFVAPDVDRRTKAGKAAVAEFEATLPEDAEVLRRADYDVCLATRDALRATKAAKILTRSEDAFAELSLVWDDEATGVRCKARLDWHTLALPGGVVFDYKSTRDASLLEFERSIYRYGYHRQGAMYLDASAAVGIPAETFVIGAVEKEPPFGVGIYRLTEGAIGAGREEVSAALERYAECLEKDLWPGYPDRIEEISLPAYAWKQIDERISRIRGEA